MKGFSIITFGLACVVLFYYAYFIIEDLLKKGSVNYINWMTQTLDNMFVKITPQKCLIIVASSTLVFSLLGLYLTITWGTFLNIVMTVSFAFLGWNAPRFYINLQYRQRLEKFDKQLIDALTMMSNSLKSGLNLNQVIGVVVREFPNPISQEFGLVLNLHQLGLTIDEALEKMMQRVPTEDLILVINSILILREKGGDISETFDTIAHTIRERRKVEGKIKTITAQGRMQSLMLFIMPFAIGTLLYVLNPDNMKIMFTTGMGRVIILIMLVMQAIGGFWLKKIVDIKV